MQYKSVSSNLVGKLVVSVALYAALALGTVAAEPIEAGLTECDHGCMIATLSGSRDGLATYQVTSVIPLGISAHVSNGPGELGFTR